MVGGTEITCQPQVEVQGITGSVVRFARETLNGVGVTLPINAMVKDATNAKLEATYTNEKLTVVLA